MPKEITMHQCEICGEIYPTTEEAIECESRGREIPLASIGDIVEYEIEMGGGFSSMYIPLRISNIEDIGHCFIYDFEQGYNGEWDEAPYQVYGEKEFQRRVKITK